MKNKGKKRSMGKSRKNGLQAKLPRRKQKTLKELKLSWEKIYGALVKTLPDAVTITDLKGNVIYASQKTIKIHGFKNRKEVIGMSSFEMIAPEDRKKAMENLKKTMTKGFVRNVEYTFLRKDGSRFRSELSASAIKDNEGIPIGFIAATRDITESERIRMSIEESEAKYQSVVEQSIEGIVIIQNMHIVYCNSTYANTIEYTVDELKSFSPEQIKALVHPDDQELVWGNMIARLKGKSVPEQYEFRAITKSGKVLWVEIFSKLIQYNGKPATQSVLIDVSERNKAELELREREEQYRSLQSNVPVGVFRTSADPSGHMLSTNPALVRMFGYSGPLEMKNIYVSDLYLHSGDRQKFIQTISKNGEIANYEVQLKKKDGSPFWGSLSARAIKDESGNVKYFDGILEDITERKRAENLHNSIYKISEAVHSTKNLDELYRSIHIIISELMPAKNFYIAICDQTMETITFDYYVDQFDRSTRPRSSRKFSKGLTEYVLLTGKPLLADKETVKRLTKEGKVRPHGRTPVDWLGVPLKTNEKIIGVLAVQSYTKGLRLREKNMDILKFVSTQVAMAIERKAAQKALTESEEKYRWVVDNSLAGLYITQKHILKFYNQRFAEMFGYRSTEGLLEVHINKLVDPASWNLVEKQVRLRESGKKNTIQYEFEGVRKDGSRFSIEALGSRIVYEGKPAIQGTMLDITERKKAEEELRRFATTDVLTGVFNRGYGLLLFGKQLKEQKRRRSKLCICYIDVDGLKDINDTYGHKEGDEALRIVSEFFNETLKGTKSLICRLGGDEFLLIFPSCSLNKAKTMWQQIARRVKSFNARNLKPYSISLSSGFAEFDSVHQKSVDQLIAIADYEMYKDKQSKHREFR